MDAGSADVMRGRALRIKSETIGLTLCSWPREPGPSRSSRVEPKESTKPKPEWVAAVSRVFGHELAG